MKSLYSVKASGSDINFVCQNILNRDKILVSLIENYLNKKETDIISTNFNCWFLRSCCGSVDKTTDSQPWGPRSNLLAAAVVPLDKALYLHCLVPQKGLKAVGSLVACKQFAFLVARWNKSNYSIQIQGWDLVQLFDSAGKVSLRTGSCPAQTRITMLLGQTALCWSTYSKLWHHTYEFDRTLTRRKKLI